MAPRRKAITASVANETDRTLDDIVAELSNRMGSLNIHRGIVIDAAVRGLTAEKVAQGLGLPPEGPQKKKGVRS